MRYLYYCNSTYQLLNILNINWHRKNAGFENIRDYKADLFVLNTFEGAEQISKIVKEKGYFSEVFLIEKTFNNGSFHLLATIADVLSPTYYLKGKYSILKKDIYQKYDVIVTPKYSTIIDQIWRMNKRARLQLIEEGIASYCMNIPLYPRSRIYKTYNSLFRKKDFSDYEALYLIEPELYQSKNKDRIVKIPSFDQRFFDELKIDFSSFCNKEKLGKSIYWMSQFLNNRLFNESVVEPLLYELNDYKEEVLFCQHPRTHMDNVNNYEEADPDQIWELQLLNMPGIDDKLFISIHSTASFTAKLLFDKEPFLIMYYRLGDKDVTKVTDVFESAVKKFKESYSAPAKVMIPETIEEFKQCLRVYKNHIDKTKKQN